MAQQQQQQQQPRMDANVLERLRRDASESRQQPLPAGLGGQPWRASAVDAAAKPRIAFIVTTSDSLQQIKIWISYHKAIGVSTFYIFADGQAARGDNVAALRALPGVTVVLRDAELRKRHENSR
jgi:hypothetical protein